MNKILTLLIISLTLILSGNAFAHTGPVEHMRIENNSLHLLLHTAMILMIGVGAFLISRWVIQRQLNSKHTQH